MNKSKTNSKNILDNDNESTKTIKKLPQVKISHLSIILLFTSL